MDKIQNKFMSKKYLKIFIFFSAIIIFSVVLRFLPHPPNFTSVGALALISGLVLKSRLAVLIAPAVLFLSDIFIGFYDWRVMISVYLGFVLYFGVSKILGGGKERFFLGPLAGASIFFILTNFAVWAFSPMYPQTLEGLITAYILALPFFKNMILADFAFFTVFSGALYLILNFSDFKTKIFGLLHFSKKNKVSASF